MKRVALKQKTPLKRGKPLNRYSLKRVAELNAELPVREKLCHQADGVPFYYDTVATVSGKHVLIKHLACLHGICQKCGRRMPQVDPHEEPFRSHGGKVSLKDSKMWCRDCQATRHGNPMWSKKE